MILATIPAILCSLVMIVPGMIFDQPCNSPYFYFSRILLLDRTSFLPISLTAFCLVLSLLLPLNPKRAALARHLDDD